MMNILLCRTATPITSSCSGNGKEYCRGTSPRYGRQIPTIQYGVPNTVQHHQHDRLHHRLDHRHHHHHHHDFYVATIGAVEQSTVRHHEGKTLVNIKIALRSLDFVVRFLVKVFRTVNNEIIQEFLFQVFIAK